jgi:predicted esterase
VFIGHGSEDPKVSVRLGEKMSRVLSIGLGISITWKSYEGLGHWYRVEDEIQNILEFLESHAGILVEHGFSVPS